ncbi:MAG: hypothetical protein HYV60_01940 [Planctomycetia bacterium]|nr:hypothetical protein [Planctomycetia bacterium]
MAELYTTRQDNRPFQAASSVPSTLRPALGAGDRVVFDFTDTRRVHRRIYVNQPLPPSFANGTWTRSISSTEYRSNGAKAIHVHWPYAILGGKLTMSSTDFPSDIAAAVSIDGNTFEPLVKVNENGDTFFLLEAWIERQPTAVYDYWLRINDNRDSVAPPSAAGITLHTHFQFAPRAHAHD